MPKNRETPATEAIRSLRMELRDDLSRFADVDVHFFAGYVLAWLASNLALGALEDLVEELDSVLRVDGKRVLDRPANRHQR